MLISPAVVLASIRSLLSTVGSLAKAAFFLFHFVFNYRHLKKETRAYYTYNHCYYPEWRPFNNPEEAVLMGWLVFKHNSVLFIGWVRFCLIDFCQMWNNPSAQTCRYVKAFAFLLYLCTLTRRFRCCLYVAAYPPDFNFLIVSINSDWGRTLAPSWLDVIVCARASRSVAHLHSSGALQSRESFGWLRC